MGPGVELPRPSADGHDSADRREPAIRKRCTREPFRTETLAALSSAQRPYATVLGCSDSRVPPEWVFDAGVGELFVIRVAGNVLSPEVAGSLQYAGSYLQTPFFVVLGHEGCGAISAALATKHNGEQFRSRLQLLLQSVVPGLPDFDAGLPPEERLCRPSRQRAVDGPADPQSPGAGRVAEGG